MQAALGARVLPDHPVLLLEPVELFKVELVDGTRQLYPLHSQVLVVRLEVIYRLDEGLCVVGTWHATVHAAFGQLDLQCVGERHVAEPVCG